MFELPVQDVQSLLRESAAEKASPRHPTESLKHPMAKRGFALLPRRWVVERSFTWAARFCRLAREYERLDTTLKGFHHARRMFHLLSTTA